MLVPDAFRAMPRWWYDVAGARWLDDLPTLVAEQCRRWGLDVDGAPSYGSNALVIPVRRTTGSDAPDRLALRLAPPGDDTATEAAALRFWNGAGTVLLIDVDLDRRALLLERLHRPTLAERPLDEAMAVLAALMRRLAIPAPAETLTTAAIAADEAAHFAERWERQAAPTSPAVLDEAVTTAVRLSGRAPGDLAVNGDWHDRQVLRGEREPWLVVDPLLLRGDIAYDLGRILWSRLDEMPTPSAVRRQFHRIAVGADLDPDVARDWVVVRAMSYLLWGLEHGLTEDPVRCQRLLAVFG
jgi:streptomycin 6-kinase